MSIPNIEKLFQYLQCVSVKPIKYIKSQDKEEYIGDIITGIYLNDTFFHTDSCNMCGGCDPAEANVYTTSEYNTILNYNKQEFDEVGLDSKYLEKLKAGLYEKHHMINDSQISVYVYDCESNEIFLPVRNRILERCTWCFSDDENHFKCRIHPVESITCIMPHLRFFHTRGSHNTSMGISQFGRNWALGCSVAFAEPNNQEQFEFNKENRLFKLKRLNQIGLDLNIETFLPNVIIYVETCTFENYKSKLHKNVLNYSEQRKLF